MDKILDFKKGKTFGASKFYRFQCDCLTPRDAMDIEVDAQGKDGEEKSFILLLYFRDKSFLSRLKYVWQILKGWWCWREFVVREEDTKELSEIFNPEKKYSELPRKMSTGSRIPEEE